ncbi:MAG: GNAT family N-acetyltransferase [Pseudomonadota bacterium]|nr:GNAT family N-acetyltransferase [Pseudomonadota bacterium]
MIVAQTERLLIRWLEPGDAAFVLRLVNEPSWLRYIGDKGVKCIEDAEAYIRNGPRASCERLGFGLNAVTLADTGEPIGICGLIKRDTLPCVDLGFALLPAFSGQGYAAEASAAVIGHGRQVLGFTRVLAIVTHDNQSSHRLLSKLGFEREGKVRLAPDSDALDLYASEPEAPT